MGIGSLLFISGLEQIFTLGFTSVIVLGHSIYYPRFGYVPEIKFGFRSPLDVPDEVFMALELGAGALSSVPEIVEYPEEFLEYS